MYWPRVLAGYRFSSLRGRSNENVVPSAPERGFHQLQDRTLILDDEDGFVAFLVRLRSLSVRRTLRRFCNQREVHAESASATGIALDGDVPSALLGNAIDRGKTQAGSFTQRLSGEERFEDVGLGLGIHSDTVVCHFEHDKPAACGH